MLKYSEVGVDGGNAGAQWFSHMSIRSRSTWSKETAQVNE